MTICRGTEAALRRPAEPWDSHAVLRAGKQRPLRGHAADADFCGGGVIPTRRVKSISKLFCIEDLIRRDFI